MDYSKVELLKYLTEDELNSFKHKPKIESYKNGEYIFNPSDNADQMYIIYEGYMKILMYLSDGREQIIYIYGKGDFVGGLNILTGDDYAYTGVAIKDCKIVVIHKVDFENVLLKSNKFLSKMLMQSYKRIRKGEELIDRLAVINADMKVAKLLINLMGVYGVKTSDGILIDINMNREELGSYTGISRETMSRKLSYFEDMGYIKLLGHGKILILDKNSLKDIGV